MQATKLITAVGTGMNVNSALDEAAAYAQTAITRRQMENEYSETTSVSHHWQIINGQVVATIVVAMSQ